MPSAVRLAGLLDRVRDRQAIDAGHRLDRAARRSPSWTNIGSTRSAGDELGLAHEVAQHAGLAQPPQAGGGEGHRPQCRSDRPRLPLLSSLDDASCAIRAIGRDRPGIVAGVTAVLLRHGVNVEDSQMAHPRRPLHDDADPRRAGRRRPRALGRRARRAGGSARAGGARRCATSSRSPRQRRSRRTSSPSTASTIPASSTPPRARSPSRASTSPTSTRGCSRSRATQPLYVLMMEVVVPADVERRTLRARAAATAELRGRRRQRARARAPRAVGGRSARSCCYPHRALKTAARELARATPPRPSA